MDKIDFLKYQKFPLSSETLDFLQNMVRVMATAVGMGGNSYILSGCDVVGGAASSGVVVIDGEILPFEGGMVETYVIITETKRSIVAEGQLYDEIYITRRCRFGTGAGQVEWSSLLRPNNLFVLTDALNALSSAFASHTGDHRVDWDNVDNKPEIPESMVLATGVVSVGNPATNQLITVTFTSVGTNAYIVVGSFVGQTSIANWQNDNGIMWIVRDLQQDQFKLLIREAANETQNLSFRYALIKL